MSGDYIPQDISALVKLRAKECCEICRLPQTFQEAEFHVDHIWPRSHGGETNLQNLALLCVGCSLRKGDRIYIIDSTTRRRVRLFNPRVDQWNDHFEWAPDWKLLGITSKGRATILALKINRLRIVKLRRFFGEMGLFPPAD